MSMKKKVLTLVLPMRDGKVLLGMKKRGFGVGKWNGFGGKVEEGESIEEAAARELFEECGIRALNLVPRAVQTFRFEGSDVPLEVHVFSLTAWEGEPQESEEMSAEWFSFDAIPLKKMWADDAHWFPLLLSGKNWNAEFDFDKSGKTIFRQTITERV